MTSDVSGLLVILRAYMYWEMLLMVGFLVMFP